MNSQPLSQNKPCWGNGLPVLLTFALLITVSVFSMPTCSQLLMRMQIITTFQDCGFIKTTSYVQVKD